MKRWIFLMVFSLTAACEGAPTTSTDAAPVDNGAVDTGAPDVSAPDVSTPDVSTPDVSVADAGRPSPCLDSPNELPRLPAAGLPCELIPPSF